MRRTAACGAGGGSSPILESSVAADFATRVRCYVESMDEAERIIGRSRMNAASIWFIGSLLIASLLGSSRAFPASLDPEAQQFFQQSLEAMFSKCGNSYFTKWYPTGFKSATYIVIQFKDLSTTLTPEPLTDSDRRQEIEWKGKAVLRSTGRRTFPVDASTKNSWGEWLGRRSSLNPILQIQKRRGQWNLSVPTQFGPYGLTAFERIDCNNVPPAD
jgi:hypothetical protein